MLPEAMEDVWNGGGAADTVTLPAQRRHGAVPGVMP